MEKQWHLCANALTLALVTSNKWIKMEYVSVCVTCFAIILGIFYIWAKIKLQYWQRKNVPTLPTNFLFGNLKDSIFLRVSPGYLLGQLHNAACDDTPFLGVYIMQKPFLLLRDPSLIKQVLIRDFNVFSNRHFAGRTTNDRMGTDNLFSINNPEWKYLRTKLSPAFTSGKIKAIFDLMIDTSNYFKHFLDEKFEDNSTKIESIDVKDASTMYTTDVIASVAFGVSTNSFAHPTPEFYSRSRMPPSLLGFFGLFSAFFFPNISRFFSFTFFGKNQDYFRRVFWDSMHTREQEAFERGDLIDSLVKLKNEKQDSQFQFKGDSLVAQSAIFFIAGLESSATTMGFALWEVARNQEIQKRVREEIRAHIKKNGLAYDTIFNLKYLVQIINETMRFYPPAPIIDRVANEDYKIPGTDVIIEKGTPVYVALPGLHMDPRFHRNPEIFDPDRFSDERKNEMEPFTYMPFGEGPRICIGARIGLLQTMIGLIRVLNDYEVSVDPKLSAKVSTRNVFTTPENGIHLLFKKLDG